MRNEYHKDTGEVVLSIFGCITLFGMAAYFGHNIIVNDETLGMKFGALITIWLPTLLGAVYHANTVRKGIKELILPYLKSTTRLSRV